MVEKCRGGGVTLAAQGPPRSTESAAGEGGMYVKIISDSSLTKQDKRVETDSNEVMCVRDISEEW